MEILFLLELHNNFFVLNIFIKLLTLDVQVDISTNSECSKFKKKFIFLKERLPLFETRKRVYVDGEKIIFQRLNDLLGPFIVTFVNFKKRPATTFIASYNMGSCPFN